VLKKRNNRKNNLEKATPSLVRNIKAVMVKEKIIFNLHTSKNSSMKPLLTKSL
jgi:hypothetical protein